MATTPLLPRVFRIPALLLPWCCAALLFPATAASQSTFSAERLTEAARSHVQRLAPDATIEMAGTVADQTFAQSGVQARIREGALSGGSAQNVVVEFVHDGRVIRQTTIPFRVSRTVAVPVADRPLPAGTVLTAGHITVEQRPAQSVRARALLPADSVIGRKLTTAVSASEPLTADNLTSADGISRGQTVTLVVRSGTIVITAQARALSDALPGEPVTVVRNGSTAAIRGVALGNGMVEAGR